MALANKFIFILILFLITSSAEAALRVVSLAPVISEWSGLILGKEAARDTLVGVSEYSNYPEFVSKIPTVGPYPKINIEKVLELKPDLVIASSEYNSEEQLQKLEKLHLKVKRLPKEQFSKMGEWVLSLGTLLGRAQDGKQKQIEWNALVAELKAKVKAGEKKETRYFIEVQHLPLVSVGGGSFITEAFQLMGWKNIFESLPQGYPKVSTEAVLKENPDQIFILTLTDFDATSQESQNFWKKFSNLHAVKTNAVRTLSGDDFARCSLRLLKALKQLE